MSSLFGCTRSRLRRIFVSITCVLAVTLYSSSLLARPVDDVIDSGRLVVFAYSDYAPYSWKDESGEAQGIDVEIARRFGEVLDVEIEFLIRGADENLDDDLRVNIWKGDMIHGKYADVMMHVPYDREVDARNELAVLSSPYFQEQMALVFNRKKHPSVDTFGRFVTNPIAVELDTAGDFFLSNAFRGQLQQSIRRGRTFKDAQQLYASQEVGALLGSRAQAEWVLFSVPDVDSEVVQPPMPGIVRTGWPIGIAVKHDSRDLAYALGDVLTEMIASGDMKALYARYGVEWLPAELP